jgi:hypothetical protein
MSKLKSLHKMSPQVTCHFIALLGEKIAELHMKGGVFIDDNEYRVKHFSILKEMPEITVEAEALINKLKLALKVNIRIVSDDDLLRLLNGAMQYRIGLDEVYQAAIREQQMAPESAKNGHFVPRWRQRQTVFALKHVHRHNRRR